MVGIVKWREVVRKIPLKNEEEPRVGAKVKGGRRRCRSWRASRRMSCSESHGETITITTSTSISLSFHFPPKTTLSLSSSPSHFLTFFTPSLYEPTWNLPHFPIYTAIMVPSLPHTSLTVFNLLIIIHSMRFSILFSFFVFYILNK